MKTTIDIHDELLARAEQYARDSGRSLYAVVEEGLRQVLPALSGELADLADLSSRSTTKLAEKGRQVQEVHRTYKSRIETLRSDAALDGFAVSERSEGAFWSFMKSAPRARAAEVVLVDNGNLRAVWDGNDGEHFGLQFVGSHALQYVIFRRRTGSSHISRVAGNDTLDGVKRQIRAFELEALLET